MKRVAYFRPLLWGHYHVMLGLLMWSEHTGDQRAQVAAERIADLVCQTCLGTGFRVFDAAIERRRKFVADPPKHTYQEP